MPQNPNEPYIVGDERGETTVWPVFTSAPQYLPADSRPGEYEKRIGEDGQELLSGICASCAERVEEGAPYMIRYHDTIKPGGIFHTRCAPTDPAWYGVEGDGDD